MLLKNWIVEYYTVYCTLDLKPTTINSYLTTLAKIPDSFELETMTKTQLQLFINSISRDLATQTVKHYYTVIKQAIEHASEFGLPDRTEVLKGIRLPRPRGRIVRALTDEELATLMPYIYTSKFKEIYLLLLNTGLRIGELLALTSAAVNLKSKALYIDTTYYRGQIYNTTKTAAGARVVPLNEIAFRIVRNRFSLNPTTPLFSGTRTEYQSYNTVQKEWQRITSEAKLRGYGLHSLRHTFATQLLSEGAPLEVVSKILGHKSVSITADIYTDITLKQKQTAINLISIGI